MARADRAADVPDDGEYQSWDDFWAEVQREQSGKVETEVIAGVVVPVPHDLPLHIVQRGEALALDADDNAIKGLVAEIFGAEIFDAWVAAGMTMVGFQTALAWGIACGSGARISFRRAYEAVRSGGKSLAPNRTVRRQSVRSGGPSRRTSTASTGSRRKA